MDNKKSNSNGLLAEDIKKLVIYDELNKKEIAVITTDFVTTAEEHITIRTLFNPNV